MPSTAAFGIARSLVATNVCVLLVIGADEKPEVPVVGAAEGVRLNTPWPGTAFLGVRERPLSRPAWGSASLC